MAHTRSFDLRAPDPIGRDLALYRIRTYRFTDDLRHYVLAEQLEERYLAGDRLSAGTLGYVRDCLDNIRRRGCVPEFSTDAATANHIDVGLELNARRPLGYLNGSPVMPTSVLAIVGAPRSGTSHLHNLLARTGRFAYFTTVSCWAWPTRNLTRPGRRLFTDISDDVLTMDNKITRLLPGLVMPYEAEDVHQRAIPTYRHISGHRYQLTNAQLDRPEIMSAAVSDHMAYFGRDILLTKSPFNSLRIPLLESIWGHRVLYVHIVRDRDQTAGSMRRNRFEFSIEKKQLKAEDAWEYFTEAVRRQAPADRIITVHHSSLLGAPGPIVAAIMSRI